MNGVDMKAAEREAFELGVEAAKAAASWVTDGNTAAEHYEQLAAMIDVGDPLLDIYLPATPNLSGEWADDPTPDSLARDILGSDCPRCGNAGTYIGDDGYAECKCSDNGVEPVAHDPEIVDALADAWERGVDETFMAECERLVREAASR